jgi:uncharacterized peroxidase-related enzyme
MEPTSLRPFIALPNLPGILALLSYSPKTGKILSQLAHELLHSPGPLTLEDRELIATLVSARNSCKFCTESHKAVAVAHAQGNKERAEEVLDYVYSHSDLKECTASQKIYLRLAFYVAWDTEILDHEVMHDLIQEAKAKGITDQEIHDVILIASAFCMYNRYVEGLGTLLPENPDEFFKAAGERLARDGYIPPEGEMDGKST